MNDRVYIVYLDVFFMINFIMDYMIILITSRIAKVKKKRIRQLAGAGCGALYSVIVIKPLTNHLFKITLVNILIAAVMVLISFGFTSASVYIKNVFLLFVVSFTMSGIINYLYYSTVIGKYVRNVLSGNSNKVVNARKFILVSVLAYILLSAIVRIIFSVRKDMELYYDVKITFRGKSVVVRGLYDTGNGLTEPVSGKMVHIAEYKILKPLLEGDEKAKENIYVIPFHSIGEEDGIMYGIRMDEMVVLVDDEPKFLYNPIIGIYTGNVSKRGNYSVILNRETFDGINDNKC
ncbi:sigma-E processing peptidase SpoIIGA [Bovifimicola ammoniilytica]|mgnify:FL=1|jgi:stage II sporulation protein GA (sporulation sigma-E factor processing peptidase)|uniref:sigma-E processing peptidase SpoIIGA n=1 Tax=Bovifimicola ammoniilytica TaxID=2981720 RepID=UPI000822265D|nr:sigma-E processing peptidase SpoIIGA [Bovifimicola ammoniilytica]MCU6754025.1 sigma-E processing peptidase SpoIIGA [Bovifimicola ammoniilytica]SCJ78148.1 sigma-E processing peptidase SpoIIGA [uncultured Eubacterium sp.]